MPFLKFSRDKRGYENFYLLQPTSRGKSRPRLLYWFRTPPNVKVGRGPFDPDVRKALEAQNPDVMFDWTAIVQTPVPPADTEKWRERRRLERAMRAASENESAGEEEASAPLAQLAAAPAALTLAVPEPLDAAAAAIEPPAEPRPASNVQTTSPDATPPAQRRRRRRRGRRLGQGTVPAIPVNDSAAVPSSTLEHAAPASGPEDASKGTDGPEEVEGPEV